MTDTAPHNPKALNDFLNRVQKTMSKLRADRRRLAIENHELRTELAKQNERTLADAIAEQVGTSSADVRRTMHAGGVIHDGEQIRHDAPANEYANQTVIYGRRSSPIKITEPEPSND